MTARSQWTYFLEALGRVVWFMTWRNHEGLVEMSPPLASIYTVSTAGIHHLHITTPPRLVGDRTSGFVQSLTDSSSQDNKAYLRFREGRCWKCLHCFYRAEQQTTQSLLSSGVFFVISIPYATNFCSEWSSFNMSNTHFGLPFAFIWFLDFWSCVFLHLSSKKAPPAASASMPRLQSHCFLATRLNPILQKPCNPAAVGPMGFRNAITTPCELGDYWKIYRKVSKELKPLPFSLIKLSTVQQRLICLFYPITVNIFRPNNLIRGTDGWSEAFLCAEKSGQKPI